MYSMGIDIGGTFTDFTLVNESTGTVVLDKELSTPENPAIGALRGARRIVSENGINISDLETIIHGTTLVSNTIIERTGAKTGLLTTDGTRDVLEIRRGWRYDIDDWQISYPTPLVPRDRRLEVSERLDSDGKIVEPLDVEELERAVDTLVEDHDVDAIAVAFLHSYANAEHEQAVREHIQGNYPSVSISLSSEVAGIIREYERTSTTVINAYTVPVMNEYLGYLQEELDADGFSGELYMMTSNGGILDVETAKTEPIRLVGSGPAAGVLASRLFGRQHDRQQLFTFDMGGTTAKGAVIEDGTVPMIYRTDVAREHRFKEGSGYDLVSPMIELTEIGAGGGSIATINDVGLMDVGPQSAGADPGPICYGRGGQRPTVTDALLLLGYLDPENFFSGRMDLTVEQTEDIFMEELADPLELSVTEAAWSVFEIVCENMATAFRQHASSKGADPRTQTIVATGGAGPAHAYRVAEKIGISEIICPHGAGVASSIGLMKAPRSYETASTSRGTLNSLDSDDFEAEFSALYEEAREVLVQAGCNEENLISRLSLDMRHVDQGQEIKVELPDVKLDTVTPSLAREHFEATYRDRFDRDSLDHPIEVMTYRVDLREPESRTSFSRQSADTVNESTNDRDIYVGETGTIGATVHQWDALDPGTAVSGPAVIEAAHTTAVVGPEWTATVEENMDITMTQEVES